MNMTQINIFDIFENVNILVFENWPHLGLTEVSVLGLVLQINRLNGAPGMVLSTSFYPRHGQYQLANLQKSTYILETNTHMDKMLL